MRTGLTLIASLAACSALAADAWDSPFPGVQHLHRTGPNNFNVHATVVDLCAPGVSVRHSAYEERAQRTSAFATSVGAQVAINGDFSCRPIDVGPNSPFPPCVGRAAYTTYGVAAHAGQPWPNTLSLDAMLAFGPDRAQVFDDDEDQPFAPWMSEVLGGHWSLVRDGQPLPNDCPIDPRSGVGLSKDHNKLIMAVADGRGSWRGMTCLEMGQLLIELGADRGFALDSGGSTTMWIQGQGVLNHPSDGTERVVGSSLAVFAGGSGRPAYCEQAPTQINPGAAMPALVPVGPVGRYDPLTPVRLFDTRAAASSSNLVGLTRDADFRVAAQSTFSFDALGNFGVPSSATGVSINLAAADASAAGFATAWPGQLPLPGISTVNFAAGGAVSNSSLLGLGATQRLSVFTQSPAHLIADLEGYFGQTGAGLVPATPQRLMDTRSDGSQGLRANLPRVLVPPQASAPRAVVLDLAVTAPVAAGFVTVYPCDEAVPLASNLNFAAQQTVAASVTAKMGTTGVCGVSSVDTQLIVDVMGTFDAAAGLSYQAVAPVRLVDTRGPGGVWVGRTTRATLLELKIDALPQLPADTRAVAINVTATDVLDDGFAGVFPCATGWPGTSNLNFAYGQTVANAVLVGTGGGSLCVYSSGRTHLIIDLTGVFVGTQPPAPVVTPPQPPAPPTPAAPPPTPAPAPPEPASCSSVGTGPASTALLLLAAALRRRRRT